MSTRQDKQPRVVVGNDTSELMGIVKGRRYIALSEHRHNGENYYVIRGLGEIPCVWFDEVDDAMAQIEERLWTAEHPASRSNIVVCGAPDDGKTCRRWAIYRYRRDDGTATYRCGTHRIVDAAKNTGG